MKNNKLQLNADKTEYLIVASPNVLPKITLRPIIISGIKIEPSVSAKKLGVMFDKHLNMCEHVNQICRKAQFLLKKIGDIRNCLSIVTTEHLMHAYVTIKLPLYNAYFGTNYHITYKAVTNLINLSDT